jgi:hypothetical protein
MFPFQHSQSVKEIGRALGVFHDKMGVVLKGDSNPFFRSKYATLSTILTAIKEPLHESGLVFTQFPVGENELMSMVIHPESGEWIKGVYRMTPAKNDPQGQGSVITYQRRYALGAILGLNIDEDDDGNAASARSKAKRAHAADEDPTDKPPFGPGSDEDED